MATISLSVVLRFLTKLSVVNVFDELVHDILESDGERLPGLALLNGRGVSDIQGVTVDGVRLRRLYQRACLILILERQKCVHWRLTSLEEIKQDGQ